MYEEMKEQVGTRHCNPFLLLLLLLLLSVHWHWKGQTEQVGRVPDAHWVIKTSMPKGEAVVASSPLAAYMDFDSSTHRHGEPVIVPKCPLLADGVAPFQPRACPSGISFYPVSPCG